MPDIELRMLVDRYRFARKFAIGKRIIEIGCGQGLGTAMLSSEAKWCIAADVDFENIQRVKPSDVGLRLCSSATDMPFARGVVDAVVALEMIYYLPSIADFARESKRVLRDGGVLVMTLPNGSRPGFHRSPFSTKYPKVSELREDLFRMGFKVVVYGVFQLSRTRTAKLLRMVVAFSDRCHLVPRTLKGRSRLKRVLQGKLREFPGLEALNTEFVAEETRTVLITDSLEYSMIYVVAEKLR